MRIFVLSAICLVAALRLFCSLLLRDKTFLSGESKPVFVTAVCVFIGSMGGSAAAGYICEKFLNALTDKTMLTVSSALCGLIIAVLLAFAAKKLYKISGIYFPALVLSPVLSAVMTAVTFSGEDFMSLVVSAAISASGFAAVIVLWHAIKIQAEKQKYPPLFEAVCVLSGVIAVLSAV